MAGFISAQSAPENFQQEATPINLSYTHLISSPFTKYLMQMNLLDGLNFLKNGQVLAISIDLIPVQNTRIMFRCCLSQIMMSLYYMNGWGSHPSKLPLWIRHCIVSYLCPLVQVLCSVLALIKNNKQHHFCSVL